MSASPLEAIIFDVGEVFIHWEPYWCYRDLYTREEWEKVANLVDFPGMNRLIDAGATIGQVSELMGSRGQLAKQVFDRYAYHSELSLDSLIAGMDDLLALLLGESSSLDFELCGRLPAVYVLSNWSAELFPNALEICPRLARVKDTIVSGAVGLIKPDERIFRLAIERFGVDPQTTLFVDDKQENCVAAAKVGLRAHCFGGLDGLLPVLVAGGVLRPRF